MVPALLVVIIGVVMQAGSALAVWVIEAVGVWNPLAEDVFAAVVLAAFRPRSLRPPAKAIA